MIKVTLRKNLRYFEAEDADFSITAGEIKIMPERCIKAYSIKNYFINGRLFLIEGSIKFNSKESEIYMSGLHPKTLYVREFNQYLVKKLDDDFEKLEVIAEDKLPDDVKVAFNVKVKPKVNQPLIIEKAEVKPKEEKLKIKK